MTKFCCYPECKREGNIRLKFPNANITVYMCSYHKRALQRIYRNADWNNEQEAEKIYYEVLRPFGVFK